LILLALIIPWSQVRVLAGPPLLIKVMALGIETRGYESLGVSHRGEPGAGTPRGAI